MKMENDYSSIFNRRLFLGGVYIVLINSAFTLIYHFLKLQLFIDHSDITFFIITTIIILVFWYKWDRRIKQSDELQEKRKLNSRILTINDWFLSLPYTDKINIHTRELNKKEGTEE